MDSTRSSPVRLAIVNDYDVVVAGLRAMLAPFTDRVRVIQAVTALPSPGSADVVLLDTFGRPDAEARLSEVAAATRAKVLTYAWGAAPEMTGIPSRGAAGHLTKDATAEELVAAVEAVARGHRIVDSSPDSPPHQLSGWPGQSQGLSPREAEMVALVVAGLSNREIAAATFLSINSVKTYVRIAYQKMQVNSRSRAILWGLENGFHAPAAHVVAPRRD